MTIQEKIKRIREKCIEANPEIVELKFGCEVEIYADNGKEHRGGYEHFKGLIVGGNDKFWNIKYNGMEGSFPKTMKFKIIGRPIHLADVLLAVTKEKFDGAQFDAMGRKEVHDICRLWVLEDDNLEKQLPECIDFIYNLINK